MKVSRPKKKVQPRSRGRPRAFDADRALDRALEVFWRKGYEGASLPDLTRAMGINRPSLYAAFGNKESLFRKALDRYNERAAFVRDSLAAPTARAAAAALFACAADSLTQARTPRGCLMVQAALSCGDEGEPIRKELCARRAAFVDLLRERFERAQAEGDLSARADAADLARFIVTVLQGISVQAAGGATRDELRRVGETALHAWPV